METSRRAFLRLGHMVTGCSLAGMQGLQAAQRERIATNLAGS